MSTPISSSPKFTEPLDGSNAVTAAIPSAASSAQTPVNAVVAPTMASKDSGTAGAPDPEHPSPLPAQAPAPTSTQPLPGSEPRLVSLAHPMDNAVMEPGPVAQDKHGQTGGLAGTRDVRIDSLQQLEALVIRLRAGVQVGRVALCIDFGKLPAKGLSGCKSIPSLRTLLDAAGGIKALDLSACKPEHGDFQALAGFLSSGRCKLEALYLSENAVSDPVAHELSHAIRCNDSLKVLSLRSATLTPSGWTFLVTALSAGWPCIGAPMGGRRFETLVLESTRMHAVPLHLLGSVIRDNPCLRELVVSSAPTCSEGTALPADDWAEEFDRFCETLTTNGSLMKLDLSCYKICAANLDKLILALGAHPCLEELLLGVSQPTPEQAGKLAAILERNALANHARHDPAAAAALDLLVPAADGTVDTWPPELSDVIASQMHGRTLLAMKEGLEVAFALPKLS